MLSADRWRRRPDRQAAERAPDFPTSPVYVLGAGEGAETTMISEMEDFTSSRSFRMSGRLAFVADDHTAPGGSLPVNTNGGGLSYMHSGMYGMYALQESMRQMRGIAPAQVPGAKISVAPGVGGMFGVSSTIVLGNQRH